MADEKEEGKLKWMDLLERGFQWGGRENDAHDSPLDCSGVVEVILVRLGLAEFGDLDYLTHARHYDTASDAPMPDFVRHYSEMFEFVGRQLSQAILPGDVVVQDLTKTGQGMHISVLINPRRRTWLSSFKDFGVRSLTDRHMTPLVGVYRVKAGWNK